MFLEWLGKTVTTIDQLLWYIGLVPPPPLSSSKPPDSDSGSPDLPPPPEHAIDIRRPVFFALVIGIDDYKFIRRLNGCVADARDMVDYLTDTLCVPRTHIETLYNEQATRLAIKERISALASDDRIKPGDAIVIFFSGHGAEAKTPPGWAAGRPTIQMLLPVDFKPEVNEEEAWQGIPDITLAALLSDLAKAKGDNITVIHDCCHSGSSTREDDEPEYPDMQPRGIKLAGDYQILSSIDSDIFDGGPRISMTSTGFEKTAMSSHVLLAACSESMLAHESIDSSGKTRGHFTRELLSFLRQPIIQGSAITYTELIERLPDLPAQYPQCDGDNRGRILFNGKAPKRGKMLYQVYVTKSIITLRAGEAQGITQNAIFYIFPSSDTTVPVGQLQVSKVRACSSVLKRIEDDPPFDIPPSSWALLAKAGEGVDISVAIPLEDSFLLLFLRIVQEMELQRPEKRNIQAVEPTIPHDLALTAENGKAIFDITDTDSLYSVFASAADFFFHLRRSNHNSNKKFLTLETYRLEEQGLWYGPVGDNLCPDGAETLRIVAGPDREDAIDYGFKLINDSPENLYVWAFMFDMSALSIRCIYRPPTAKLKKNALNSHAGPVVPADASVLAGESLSIGYGSGGGKPQSFILQGDDKIDVSYLKLFVTNQYVDLSYIEQDSPFKEGGRVNRDSTSVREVWDTVRLMIIQQRAI